MLRVLTAEGSGRNIARLILGVVCAFALMRAMLAASVLAGLARYANAHAGIDAAPLQHLILATLIAVATWLAFNRCDRGRAATARQRCILDR